MGGSPKIGGLGAPPVLWEGSRQVTMPFHFRGIQSESKPTTRTQSTNFQPSWLLGAWKKQNDIPPERVVQNGDDLPLDGIRKKSHELNKSKSAPSRIVINWVSNPYTNSRK